jgi:hypothetical protein
VHSLQVDALVAPLVVEKVPGKHGVQEGEPSASE